MRRSTETMVTAVRLAESLARAKFEAETLSRLLNADKNSPEWLRRIDRQLDNIILDLVEMDAVDIVSALEINQPNYL